MRLIALLWLLLAAPLQAQTALQQVQAQLRPSAVLRGEFAQEKVVQGFRNPLRSCGQFLLARERGVVWRSEQPFASVLVLSRAGLRVDGAAQALPDQALTQVQQLLLALIGGDLERLDAQFELQASHDDRGWQLQATPRDPALAQRLRDLRLRGGAFVDEVSFSDAQGNRTTIRFSAQRAEPDQLSDDERAAFD